MPKTPLALALFTLLASPALAQADATGTGGGPDSTLKASNTNSLGVTKPPSGASDPTTGRGDPNRITHTEHKENEMMTGICDGCGPK